MITLDLPSEKAAQMWLENLPRAYAYAEKHGMIDPQQCQQAIRDARMALRRLLNGDTR